MFTKAQPVLARFVFFVLGNPSRHKSSDWHLLLAHRLGVLSGGFFASTSILKIVPAVCWTHGSCHSAHPLLSRPSSPLGAPAITTTRMFCCRVFWGALFWSPYVEIGPRGIPFVTTCSVLSSGKSSSRFLASWLAVLLSISWAVHSFRVIFEFLLLPTPYTTSASLRFVCVHARICITGKWVWDFPPLVE